MGKVLLDGFAMNVDVHEGLVPMDTLFIHGNLASNTWWQPSVELWRTSAKPSYEGRLILGEWRGCGQSDAPHGEENLHPKVMANDYVQLLRKMGVKKACVVGHSTGGLIALYALLQAPELFDRVVLLDSVGATGVQFEKPMFDAFTQMSQDRAFCATVMGGTIHGNNPDNPLFQKIVDDTFHVAKEVWHGIPKALYDINIADKLAQIQQPVLVLHGEHDNVLPKEGSVALAQSLPNARFQEIKGQGHSTNFENPALFVSLVNEFLYNRT